MIKNCMLCLFILKNYNSFTAWYSLLTLVFLLCFKLHFQFCFIFLAVWKGGFVACCSFSPLSWARWLLEAPAPWLHLPSVLSAFWSKDVKGSGSRCLEWVLLRGDSCSLLGAGTLQKALHSQQGRWMRAGWVVLVAADLGCWSLEGIQPLMKIDTFA